MIFEHQWTNFFANFDTEIPFILELSESQAGEVGLLQQSSKNPAEGRIFSIILGFFSPLFHLTFHIWEVKTLSLGFLKSPPTLKIHGTMA